MLSARHRMLRLISEHLFNLSNPTAAEEDNTFLDKPLCGTTRVTKANLGPSEYFSIQVV